MANRWEKTLWKPGAKSNNDDCGTPQDFFDKLNSEFHFTLDACANRDNYKVARYFSTDGSGIAEDGLLQDWAGETVWVNPPYSKIKLWMKKCFEESLKPYTTVVALTFARTDTEWFWAYVVGNAEIRFVKGRLKFTGDGNKWASPAPSIVIVWKRKKE